MPDNLSSFLSGAKNIASTASQTVGAISKGVDNFKTGGFKSLFSSSLPKGAVPSKGTNSAASFNSGAQRDWRVRLSMPSGTAYDTSELLQPLAITNGLVFPYTPTINISHQANYQASSPVHNNYPFLSYENSKVDNITITGDFYCEDSVEAQYWIAAVHYFRSVTKMKFGADADAGAPPPVVKLNGYGDYVFKDVPVVVTNFTMDLPKDVDYIATGLGATAARNRDANIARETSDGVGLSVAWAPVKSTFTVTVQPLYSREQQRNFSLDAFIKGDYIKKGTGYL